MQVYRAIVSVWIFFMTFVLMPLSSYLWITDPIWLPWGYLFSILVPVVTVYMIFVWFSDRGYISE